MNENFREQVSRRQNQIFPLADLQFKLVLIIFAHQRELSIFSMQYVVGVMKYQFYESNSMKVSKCFV